MLGLDRSAKIDGEVQKRLDRGRARHRNWHPGWAEALAFFEGSQYVYRSALSPNGTLTNLETREFGNKPRWKARTTRNYIAKFVMAEVSNGTQRLPGYEVTPTTTDPEDVQAARLAEKILLYLYDYIGLRKVLVDAYTYAVVCGEGFVRPYFNRTAGEPLPDVEGEDPLYTGEVAVEALGPHEIYWEPGARFEQSRWHAVEKARTIEEVKEMPGFTGVDLKPDARGFGSFVAGQLSRSYTMNADMVMVTEYLELPCEKYPRGRRLMIANGKLVTQPEPYPCLIKGPQGYEPVIHKMPFIPTPHRDRDMGLVEQLTDAQRTLNDAINKAIEWKNLSLVPQILEPVGSLIDRPTNEPGARMRYRPIGGQKPEWRQVPSLPRELFELMDRSVQAMEEIASLRTLPQSDSAKALATYVERDQSVRAYIVQALADFHGRLGRHLLHYTQKYFTEPRLIAINGRMGAEYIPDFKGAQLRDQVNVVVLPGSIEPRTREAVRQQVLDYASRGWIAPEQAMRAIEGGTAGDLVDDFELDIAKAHRERMKLVALGNPALPGGDVPIADDFDNHAVHVFEHSKWMKTREFEEQPEDVKTATRAHIAQHKYFQQQEQMQASDAQAQLAAQRGLEYASGPRTPNPPPSLPNAA